MILTGRPGAANTTRHVGDIKNEQAVIVRLIADDSYAIAPGVRSNISTVDPNVDLIIVYVD